jgi:hypothetical protein
MAIGANWRGKDDGPYESAEQVDELLDQLRAQTIRTGEGIVAMVYRPGDDDWTGPMLEIGVKADKGFVVYNSGERGGGAISYGSDVEGDVDYYFQDNHREREAKNEVPYDIVKQAVKDFLTTNGGKPASVPWEPEPA